ncbi:uncharacterized protein LOC118755129 [Rhagoletis pomonella]|uniref:uncharacterized protein LOC118755129 n=1 Tax=Rhagoletis pomonella TaxID=28610 RepID=UPI0017835094|nr:uncharacterized protein LOC118755129 [Rhagoletis pomonella]
MQKYSSVRLTRHYNYRFQLNGQIAQDRNHCTPISHNGKSSDYEPGITAGDADKEDNQNYAAATALMIITTIILILVEVETASLLIHKGLIPTSGTGAHNGTNAGKMDFAVMDCGFDQIFNSGDPILSSDKAKHELIFPMQRDLVNKGHYQTGQPAVIRNNYWMPLVIR